MKIMVKAKTNAKKTEVTQIDECTYQVAVTAVPEKGKANRAVIAALADYFDIPKSHITILAGHTSKNKIIEILK